MCSFSASIPVYKKEKRKLSRPSVSSCTSVWYRTLRKYSGSRAPGKPFAPAYWTRCGFKVIVGRICVPLLCVIHVVHGHGIYARQLEQSECCKTNMCAYAPAIELRSSTSRALYLYKADQKKKKKLTCKTTDRHLSARKNQQPSASNRREMNLSKPQTCLLSFERTGTHTRRSRRILPLALVREAC